MLNIKIDKQRINRLLLLFIVTFIFINSGFTQPGLPQRQITVLPSQPINFGTFHVTGAGSITVDYAGKVTTSGGVVSLDQSSVTPAIFEIKLCQGKTVMVDYDYSAQLTGSNAGELELVIGPTEYGGNQVEFPVNSDCNFITVLRVGGTLNVPDKALSGFYNGSFPMTFTQK